MSVSTAVLELVERHPARLAEDRLADWNFGSSQVEKIATIHQPNYVPWIGLFSKVSRADCLILYDEAQYVKGGMINRNKIRTKQGSTYLTVPVGGYPTHTRILDVTLPQNGSWKRDHWKTIRLHYSKAPFFKDYADFFEDLFQQDPRVLFLSELNEKIILYLLSCFDIKIEVVKTSLLSVDPALHKTDLMLAYLKKVNAGVYLSGPSGRHYLETDKFPRNNIALQFFKFEHPVYPQRYPGFEPQMSALDLLFNMGPASGDIIKKSASVEDFQALMEDGDERFEQ